MARPCARRSLAQSLRPASRSNLERAKRLSVVVEADYCDGPRSKTRSKSHPGPAPRGDRQIPMTLPSKPRLLLFAFGDFAFNLYWQSIMLFLLFYYTDALTFRSAVAATIYMVASIWDGIANFLAGSSWTAGRREPLWSLARRRRGSARSHLRAHVSCPRLRRGWLGDCDRLRRAPAVPHGLCRGERALSRNDRADQSGSRRSRIRRRDRACCSGPAAAVIVALCTVLSVAG